MDTIKSKGLMTLIKDGQFNFNGIDIEVCQCLSEDLTLEEIIASIHLIEEILPKLPSIIEELTSLQEQYDAFVKKQKTSNSLFRFSIPALMLIALGIFISFFGLSAKDPDTAVGNLIFGLLMIGIGCVVSVFTARKRDSEQIFSSNEIVENEEMAFLQNRRKEICSQVGLIPENNYLLFEGIKLNTFWSCSAEKLSKRLPILLLQLKKLKVILEDKSLSSSAKMLAIAQLFSLLNNEIANAKMLKNQEQANKKLLEEMQKNNREIQAQNDLLTLQTYNKVSEMQGLDPTLVAAQTYSQMAKIRKERNGENE